MAASAWAADDEKVQVKPFMKPGTYVLKVNHATKFEGDDNPKEARIEMAMELQVTASADGGQKIIFVLKRLRQSALQSGGQWKASDETQDKKMELLIDATGDVTKFRDISRSGTDATLSPEELKKGGRLAVAQFLPHLLCAPSQPVAVGKSWEVIKNEAMEGTCKLVSLDKDAARFEVKLDMNRSRPKDTNTFTFDVLYDRKLQAATSAKATIEAFYESQIPGGGAKRNGQKVTMDLTLTPGKYEATSQPASAPTLIKD